MPDTHWVEAQALIRKHGWNTTCGQLLNPGLELWFSADRKAVVGYRVEKGRVVVAGAPVCAKESLTKVIDEFEGSQRFPVCYFGAEDRVIECLAESSARSSVVLGAQPVWSPESFLHAIAGHESLRAQLARARNKGVVVREVSEITPEIREGVKRVLGEWLETRGLPALHFLVEPQTIDVLGDRRLFVAEMHGEVCAFVVLSPIPARRGYLTEQFVRGKIAPNGTVELALSHAIQVAKSEGAEFLTMGIVPLSPHGEAAQGKNPPWLNGIVAWARAHAKRFYNFEGLDQFKAKFNPDRWDPVFVVAPEEKFTPKSLYAVASAFTEGHLGRALMGGFARSIRAEFSMARQKLLRKQETPATGNR